MASLKLAILLLVVIIVASIRGTILESNLNAEVAKHYIYSATWFNAWLIMLCVNLFCVAAIRYPWKPHQTGFVITHAGIITLLIGGMIDKQWGIEGFVPLFRGKPHTDTMSLHQENIYVYGSGVNEPAITDVMIKTIVTPDDKIFAVKSPFADVKIDVIDVQPVEPYAFAEAAEAGAPALLVTLQGPQMGRHEQWLMLNEKLKLGPAQLQFTKGMPPPVAPKADGAMTPRLERYFVFAKHEGAMGKTIVGEATGMEAKLALDAQDANPTLEVSVFAKKFKIPVMENLKKPYVLPGVEGWTLHISNYYQNFKMSADGPISLNDKPENPGVLFELSGPLVKADAATADEHAHAHGDAASANALAIYLGDDGKLRFHAKTRRAGESAGEIELNKAVAVAWAPGTEFVIGKHLPSAVAKVGWRKVEKITPMMKDKLNSGLLVKITAGESSKEAWVGQINPENMLRGAPRNELLAMEVGGKKVELGFAHKTVRLPFKVGLFKFHAPFQEGLEESTSFMSFESTLSFLENSNDKNPTPLPLRDIVRIKPDSILVDAIGTDLQIAPGVFEGAITQEDANNITFEFPVPLESEPVVIPRDQLISYEKNTHKIHMNHPTTYPSTWYGPWLGTSYKFSQAGHDMPRNKHYSGVQVLRDPGWAPKWVGCLMICFGIFTMFYLKPYFNRAKPMASTAAVAVNESQQKVQGKGKKSKKDDSEELVKV